MNLSEGDIRALANRIALRLVNDGKIEHVSKYDHEGIHKLTGTVAEEIKEYFGK